MGIKHQLIQNKEIYQQITLIQASKIFIKMKFTSILLLIAMVAIAMEKCGARYLLVEVDDVPTPRECCEASSVPEFCLGLCSPVDATARQENRINACSKYETVIEKCFQSEESKNQVTGTKLNDGGKIQSRCFGLCAAITAIASAAAAAAAAAS